MAEITTAIFDVDGTIADSFGIFVETLEEVLKHPQPLTQDEIHNMRGASTHEIIDKLGVKKWQMPILAIKGRRGIARKMGGVEAFSGMPEAMNELSEQYKLFVLSSNSEQAVTGFLGRYSLLDSVAGVYTGTSITGKAKRLESLLKKEHLTAAECVYIGDETRDIEASKQVGIRCVAVEWGYSTPAALSSCHPDVIVATPQELATAVHSL